MSFDSFDVAHSAYYLLLIILLSLSLFYRKELKFSQAFKYLALWCLIGLCLVIGYSYRYEFKSLKNRVAGELNPASTHINQENQIVIYRAKNGHFYINSEINGHFVRFMIDTGASDTSINIKDAKRLGINTTNLHFNKPYQTANGAIFAATAKVGSFKIGNVIFNDISISIANSDLGTPLLGINVLRQFTKYEVYQDKLILTP